MPVPSFLLSFLDGVRRTAQNKKRNYFIVSASVICIFRSVRCRDQRWTHSWTCTSPIKFKNWQNIFRSAATHFIIVSNNMSSQHTFVMKSTEYACSYESTSHIQVPLCLDFCRSEANISKYGINTWTLDIRVCVLKKWRGLGAYIAATSSLFVNLIYNRWKLDNTYSEYTNWKTSEISKVILNVLLRLLARKMV